MRRLATYTALTAVVGFAAGAVPGLYRGAPNEPLFNHEPLRALLRDQAGENARRQELDVEPEQDLTPISPFPLEEAVVVSPRVRDEVRSEFTSTPFDRVIELYRKGDPKGGDRLKNELTDSVERKLSEWIAIHFGVVGFDRIAAFKRANPDWPTLAALGRRAEEALLAGKPPAAVRGFFADRPPTSPEGKIVLALAAKSVGASSEAAALVRDAWRNDTFGSEFERKILDLFPAALSQADHTDRMERFLKNERWPAAIRAAGYAGTDYVLVAKARMAVAQRAPDALRVLEVVPPGLRSNKSYLLAKAQFLRRQDKADAAVQVAIADTSESASLPDGDEWWVERQLLARELLDRGNPYAAYAMVRDNVAESVEKRVDAEFHAGWIALRFLQHPATAARHFANAAQIAAKPISVARTKYWQGRAAEALGADLEARGFFEAAAAHSTTYYGQLARAKLGLSELELRTEHIDGDPAFGQLPVGQAIRRLYDGGYRDIAFALCTDVAANLTDARQLHSLAHLAADNGDARTVLSVGKIAIQRGYPLDMHAFPLQGVPIKARVDSPVDKAMIYAIARQESAFAPQAQSSAGAQGLMQLMPDTARRTARRLGLEFDLQRLLDPEYSTQLGAAHLRDLMEDWKGSLILIFASYNAGGGNVSKWIKAYGDPRSPRIDSVDWVERIPFSETRNYVQRVMEALLVYRHRLGSPNARSVREKTALSEAHSVPQ
jgi:soluble lytic murein transglycosylase